MTYREERDMLGVDTFIDKHANELKDLWHEYTMAYWGERQGRIWLSGLTKKWQCAIETRHITHPNTLTSAILELLPESDTREEAIGKANRWYVENWMGQYE